MAEHETSKTETVFEEQGSLRKPGLICPGALDRIDRWEAQRAH